MQHVYAGTGVALFTMMLMPLYRVGFGPTAIDRIVAVNVIGTKTAVLLVVIGEIFGRIEMFVDFALAYALLNFLASIAVARFFFKTRAASGELDPLP
ncbi:monovalent cation/H+ antiporter complex subunit F [Haloferula sp.]|uniref:monovalent cation/H+ antiporter complex subunit F n=1 Tax=Haloferula sp. TaxID=2497595 RepID=UPI0032A0A0C4